MGLAIDLTAPTGEERSDIAFTDHDGHRLVVYIQR